MEGNFVLSDVEEQLSEQVSLEPLLDEHLVDGFAAFDGFHNRSDAVDDVVVGHVLKNCVQIYGSFLF